ncbi:hypothetical protein [Vulcanococcus limneticus]|uniref:hypothetical protein n=1 Tax=Vulcanococcus limneticus TaxID=2170428 RepID=UPI00398C22C7
MAVLLALEPAGLRRVLKAGLRQGIEDGDLRRLIQDAFGWTEVQNQGQQLLGALEQRGWLIRHGDTWKTKLG